MRLIMLAGGGASTIVLRNWLQDQGFADVETIIEDRLPRRALLAQRRRRLGLSKVLGQLAFMALIQPALQLRSKARHAEILAQHRLRMDSPTGREMRVRSVNSEEVVRVLQDRQPDAVIVNGTRIIREHVLSSVRCPFINTHAGVTPMYRGVHGGYWALWMGDRDNFGVTIHLVDSGVDTGPILAQRRASPDNSDNFCTYPLLQQAVSFPALKQILEGTTGDALKKQEELCRTESRQWYHPTLGQYLVGRLRGVK